MNKYIATLALAFIATLLSAQQKKTLFVIVDGIIPEHMERLQPPTMMEIAKQGHYQRAYCGGELGGYSQTPTISAVGYTNILTGTWVNKHNVKGNEKQKPNYNYPTIFRIAKDQRRPVTTAIYSSWTDNRTVLLGEGKADTRNLKIDYVFDGYDIDQEKYPKQKDDLHIQAIDGRVCEEAARCLKENAPDLNWIYLWYTDDAFHIHGNGKAADHSIMVTDQQLKPVWEAVKYRERNFDEKWLVIVLTDHGRESRWGKGHGGQSASERSVWVITNQKKVNGQFFRPTLSHADINPTICEWMNFEVPRDIQFEQDGISFLGKTDIYDLQTETYDRTVTLSWKYQGGNEKAEIYVATTNHFNTGGKDLWTKVAEVPAKECKYELDLDRFGKSGFYKFVVKTPHVTLNRWLR